LTAAAYLKAMYVYDFAGANADFIRAIELEPGYATAHQWYGEILASQGRYDEAYTQIQLAMEADPLAAIMPHVMGWIMMHTDRQDEAETYFALARQLNPLLSNTIGNLFQLNLVLGHYDKAREFARELGLMRGESLSLNLALIDAVQDPSLKPAAMSLLEIQRQQGLADGVVLAASFLALLGEYELALDSLESAFKAGDPYAIHMNRMSWYKPLHDEPRYQAMLKKMNLLP
jgi:serine/threonine-protein kinase